MKSAVSCLLALILITNRHLTACLWDRDTIAAENARFPEAISLITGFFPRHSQEFYEWRRKNSQEQIAKDPAQVSLYNDLAVAQHKLGDHKAAIATMQAKEKIKPGLYETYSNLGTFYIYTGELSEAVKYIDKALAINPKAHFGREQYQKWLVQWITESKTRRILSPEDEEKDKNTLMKRMDGSPFGFAEFVAMKQANIKRYDSPLELNFTESQRGDALIGVMGMMRFANHDNPLLLEALGDLLLTGKMDQNAAQIAGLAYLHASLKTADTTEKSRLMNLFTRSGVTTMAFEPEKMEKALDVAVKKANAYIERIRLDEIEWIKDGKDVNLLYETKYLKK